MRILVAGALGEVGRTVSAALADRGHEVVAASSRAPIPGSSARSTSEASALVSAGRVDLVVNAAGRGDRRPGERTGTDATDVLAPVIASSGTPAVLLSTMRVLEGYHEPVPDEAPPRPTTPYAEANALHEAQWLAATTTGAVLRLANYFCAPAGADSPQALLLPWSLVTEAARTGSIVVRSGPQTTREFVSADDVARALEILAAERPDARVCSTVPGWQASLRDLVDSVVGAFGEVGRDEPHVSFGTEGRAAPPSEPAWLATRGWSSSLDASTVTAVMAQWLRTVRLD